MERITEFLGEYWTYLVALVSASAYIFEKVYSYWTDKKNKQQAYNRTFTAIVKLLYSYQKHKKLYAEKPSIELPLDIYVLVIKHLDSFNTDLDDFKNSILKESEIVPEISIQSHILFETADRIRIMDKMKLSEPTIHEMSDEQQLAIKRAQFYALEEIFDDFFIEIINSIKKYTTVKEEYINRLFYFNSNEYEEESKEQQNKIFRKYLESLFRQGVLPKEVFDYLNSTMKLEQGSR